MGSNMDGKTVVIEMRGIVKRDGWYFQIELIDPLIGTDVVSYDRFVLKRVRANLMSQEGLDEVIP